MNFRDDEEVIETYIEETQNRLFHIREGLLKLNQSGEHTTNTVHMIFRDVHSMKSGANLLGFKKIEYLANKLEDILQLFRDQGLLPDANSISILGNTIEKIADLIENITDMDRISVSAETGHLDKLSKKIKIK